MATKGKDFPLSITVKAVDRATGTLERINKKLETQFKPFQKLRDQFGDLGKNAGFGKISEGLKGIGSVAKSVAIGFGALAAAGAGAFHVIKGMVDEFDDLGGTASKLGVTVDALAQLRYAAERSDVEVGELDASFGQFNKQLGLARAKSGKLYGFLGKVSPVLRKQVLATKSSEEAFGLMADAIVKVEDPAKRAALATQVFGGAGASLIPLLARGSKGVEELRREYFRLAGSQEGAAGAAGEMDDELIKAKASLTGVKGAILVGLAPAFTDLTARVSRFFSANRGRIAEWAKDFGEKLPGRIEKLISVLKSVGEVLAGVGRAIGWVVEKVGGAENAVKLLAGAFVAFKGLQLVGHVAKIAQGFIGIASAARAAIPALREAGAAAAAAGGGGVPGAGLVPGGGKGRGRDPTKGLGAAAAIPFIGAALGAIDLAQFSKEDEARTARELATGSDAALLAQLPGAFGERIAAEKHAARTERWRTRAGNVGERVFGPPRPVAGPPAPEGHVVVEVKGPPGTKVTKDPKSKGVSTKNSPQLLPTP